MEKYRNPFELFLDDSAQAQQDHRYLMQQDDYLKSLKDQLKHEASNYHIVKKQISEADLFDNRTFYSSGAFAVLNRSFNDKQKVQGKEPQDWFHIGDDIAKGEMYLEFKSTILRFKI